MNVERREWPALGWAFCYFFCLLCGYYIVRPMRDEMGIAGGVEHLQWMFSGTFLAMLAVAWALDRWPGPAARTAAWCFLAGIAVFSGSLYLMVLSGQRWLGAVTPLGGVALIAGWLFLAFRVAW